ncbi:hypothetical protein Tco_0789627, partial [Tanacetum coccineum]
EPTPSLRGPMELEKLQIEQLKTIYGSGIKALDDLANEHDGNSQSTLGSLDSQVLKTLLLLGIKNYVRKFLRALHPKWKSKVMTIEESKDLTSLSPDELIGNLKFQEMIIKKDYKIIKEKVKRKSIALKAKFVRQPRNNKKTYQRICNDKNGKGDRKYFRYGNPNHLIEECPKPPKDKNRKAFVGGSWSDNGEEDDEKPDEWIKDSGCSKHMTGNQKLFSTYKAYNGGNVIFGSNLGGNIIGKGQICDNKCRVTFSEHDSENTKDVKAIEMFKKFGLEDSKQMKTPMSSDTKLTKDEECESVDSTKYRGMIAVKRIFQYIKGTTHLGLLYPKGTGIDPVVYADSDHARDYVDRKSTSGICTFMGYCLKSWFSKKQTALAISTTEAKYVSVGKACQQALWMRQALID